VATTVHDGPAPRGRLRVPLAAGVALAGAAVAVRARDPSAPGSPFPGCSFHRATGWWCPGCGLTRGTHHLLRGDLAAAVASNLFTPLVAVAVAASWLAWTLARAGRPVPIRLPRGRAPLAAALVVVVLYGVARNLPVAALEPLAP